jgi:proline-specific peptidase
VEAEGRLPVPGGHVWWRIVGSGRRTPLLVVHGGLGSVSHDYLDPLGALAGSGRRVVFWDQLGCGRSDAPPDPGVYRIERYVEEIAAVRRGLGLERVHLLGQSYGGWLALEYLAADPDGIGSVHLASTSASTEALRRSLTRRRRELPDHMREALDRQEAGGDLHAGDYLEGAAEFDRRYACRIAPAPAPLQRALELGNRGPQYGLMNGPNEFVLTGNLAAWDRTGVLAAVEAPTLVTCGRYDKFSQEECADELAERITGARLHVFEESSHMSHLEEPAAFLKVTDAFLEAAV